VAVSTLIVRQLGLQDYAQTWQAMTRFTNERQAETPDEFWLVQHPPVFTQGQAGKPEHVLFPGDIPLVHTDRGGQVTYHGPGQLVAYPLLDLRRCKLGVRDLVTLIEQTLVNVLAHYQILAKAKADAPGVYVDGAKIASLGLRVRRGCSFHGLSLNVDMDLTPFSRINPCGYQGLPMTQMREFLDSPPDFSDVQLRLAEQFAQNLGYESCTIRAG
jgi:lipoyl(octanoyl) transferase